MARNTGFRYVIFCITITRYVARNDRRAANNGRHNKVAPSLKAVTIYMYFTDMFHVHLCKSSKLFSRVFVHVFILQLLALGARLDSVNGHPQIRSDSTKGTFRQRSAGSIRNRNLISLPIMSRRRSVTVSCVDTRKNVLEHLERFHQSNPTQKRAASFTRVHQWRTDSLRFEDNLFHSFPDPDNQVSEGVSDERIILTADPGILGVLLLLIGSCYWCIGSF